MRNILFTSLAFLLLGWNGIESCKYLQSLPVREVNSLYKVKSPNYIPSALMGKAPQDISVNLSQLFQTELSIPESDVASMPIYFTDATENRPFIIQTAEAGWRLLKTEMLIDREEICDPFTYPHRAAVARKCCSSGSSFSKGESRQLDFKCCIFLDITVGNYGTYALRIEIIDVNDNAPKFISPPESVLSRPGKADMTTIKLTENSVQGTIISLPSAVDFDEGKNSALLYQIDRTMPGLYWQQYFKLLSRPEDRCLQKDITDVQKDITLPALCLLRTIDRETTSGFQFELIARDQGEPISLSSTLSASIMVCS